MKKKNRVCKNHEFSSIIGKRKFVKSGPFVLYFVPRKESYARVGISVGKKLGNAVVRNKTKRQVRSMVDTLFDFQEVYDAVLIVRPEYHKNSYEQNLEILQQIKEKADTRVRKEIK